ncbi:hypothetical protein QUA79_30135 [Microcoleus sp. F8-D1]
MNSSSPPHKMVVENGATSQLLQTIDILAFTELYLSTGRSTNNKL